MKTKIVGMLAAAVLASAAPLSAQTPEQDLCAQFAEVLGQAQAVNLRLKASPNDAQLENMLKDLLHGDRRTSQAALERMKALFKKTPDVKTQTRIVYILLVAAPDAGAPAAEEGIRSMFELRLDTPDLAQDVRTYMLATLAERCDPSGPYSDAYFDTLHQVALLN